MAKRLLLTLGLFLAFTGAAFAHVGTSGFVLLLPTQFYILGAALAVAASFALLAFLPQSAADRLLQPAPAHFVLPQLHLPIFSLLSSVLLLAFVIYGFLGPGDPFKNPLPLFIWIVWWVAFTALQFVLGDLWGLFNPWSGPVWLLRLGKTGFAKMRAGWGYWIAIVQFGCFVWLELVSTDAYDPAYLAGAVTLFWSFNFLGTLIFGEEDWRREAEPFSVFFSLVGSLSPFQRDRDKNTGRTTVTIVWPGKTAVNRPALPLSGSLFVLLTLSTVSFDGFSNTFLWVSSIGLNPLEFPGRSAVTVPMTLGLFVAFFVLAGLFLLSTAAGLRLTSNPPRFTQAVGRLVYSILPISLVFHFAHYLAYLLVQGQHAIKLASDPFGQGWDLFGTRNWYVTTSFFYNAESVLVIWNVQTVAVVLGHVAGITMAHLIALDLYRDHARAVRSQIFLAILMVGYTAFGLWLLASPKIG